MQVVAAAPFDFLSDCLRAPSIVDLTALVGEELDALSARAAIEGVAGLLLRSLRREETNVPRRLAEGLRRAATQTAAANLLRWRTLSSALSALDSAGLQVIVLKGAHLAELFYRDLSLRPMSDLDLLVRKGAVRQADSALRAGGFAPGAHNGPFTERSHYHFSYRDASGISLEVHWHLTLPAAARHIDIDGIWHRATAANAAGRRAHVLANEDLLLHLAEHLVKHRLGMGLRALCDVNEVVSACGDTIDWGAVGERAGRWRLKRAAGLMLSLSRVVLATPLPAAALAAFPADLIPPHWIDTAVTEIRTTFEGHAQDHRRGLAELLGARSRARRARAVVGTAFPPRDLLRDIYGLPIGAWRIYPYYVFRWCDLLRRYGVASVTGLATVGRRRAARERTDLFDWLEQEVEGR